MASNESQFGTEIAMSQGNTGVVWHGDKRRNSRDDLKSYAGIGKLFCLFAATAKDVGIATFEPDNGLAFARLCDQQLVELILRNRVLFGALATIDDLCRFRRESQQLGIHKRVIDHDLGTA